MKNLFSRFALSAKESASESIEAVVGGLKSSVETEEATEALADMSIKWHPEEFLPNLKFMGIGMLCIFIVIAVIILFFCSKNSLRLVIPKQDLISFHILTDTLYVLLPDTAFAIDFILSPASPQIIFSIIISSGLIYDVDLDN